MTSEPVRDVDDVQVEVRRCKALTVDPYRSTTIEQCHHVLPCPVHNDGDGLGAEYGRKMFAPIELTPEDEGKVAALLEGEIDHGG